MKKIVATVLVMVLAVSIIGCGKKNNSEEAEIRNELMSELSEADKEDIKQLQSELNGEYDYEGENEEKTEAEAFTPEDFPCDPVVQNSKWSDCYFQVADVVVQEYHNVPIMEVISSFENSKLGFKAEDFDPEMEFPFNKTIQSIYMSSDYGSVTLLCGIDMDDAEGKVLKMKDVSFLYIEDVYLHDEIAACSYVSKGFRIIKTQSYGTVVGLVESDYSIREYEKIMDDDMKEIEDPALGGLEEYEKLQAMLEESAGSAVYLTNLDSNTPTVQIWYLVPQNIVAGRTDNSHNVTKRKITFAPGDNNRLYVAGMSSSDY